MPAELTLENIKFYGQKLVEGRATIKYLTLITSSLNQCVRSERPIDEIKTVEEALFTYLHVTDKTIENWKDNAIISINFKKNKTLFYEYLASILKFATQTKSTGSLLAIMNHIKSLLLFFLTFNKLYKELFDFLISKWANDTDESVQILAYLIISKSIPYFDYSPTRDKSKILKSESKPKKKKKSIFEIICIKMYNHYKVNVKFPTASNLTVIHFFQKSFVEILNVKPASSCIFAHNILRQMAKTLKDGYNTNQQENLNGVYNWQYINCLHLWSLFVSQNSFDAQSYKGPSIFSKLPANEISQNFKKYICKLRSAVIQLCVGVINLVPSSKYIPLRINVINSLNTICQSGVFVPVLPLISEIPKLLDFNSPFTDEESSKNLNLDLLLKASLIQLREQIFRDEIIGRIYDLTMEYTINYVYSVAFPEITLVFRTQLKTFLKNSKNTAQRAVIKQLLTKLEENVKFIKEKRKQIFLPTEDHNTINIEKMMVQFEENWKQEKDSPLEQYFYKWKELRTQERLDEITQRKKISNYNNTLFNLKQSKKQNKNISEKNHTMQPNKKTKLSGKQTFKISNDVVLADEDIFKIK